MQKWIVLELHVPMVLRVESLLILIHQALVQSHPAEISVDIRLDVFTF